MTGPSDLVRKLGIKPGQTVCILGATSSQIADLLRQQCPVLKIFDTLDDQRFDLIFFWPQTADDLATRFVELQRHLVPDGVIWAIIQKRSSDAAQDASFGWREVQAAALTTDLVDNKVVSLSDTEYAARFVIRKSRRG